MTDKEVAKAVGKTPSAISYLKRNNPEEYEMLRTGCFCKKHGLTITILEKLLGWLELLRKDFKEVKDA